MTAHGRYESATKKAVTDLQTPAAEYASLKRVLGPINLALLGVGAIIRTGIFVLTGTVAARNSGPGMVQSFVLAGVASVFGRFRTPWITTFVTGALVAIFSALFTVRGAGSLSIETMLAFVIVSIGVLVLRIREPHLPRRFRISWIWFVAPMGALSSLYLMVSLPWKTWERLILWFLFGLTIYFGYGIRRSKAT